MNEFPVILKGKDVDGALVRGATYPLVPRAEVDAVEQRLVRPPPQLGEHQPLGGVPDADERALRRGGRYHRPLVVHGHAPDGVLRAGLSVLLLDVMSLLSSLSFFEWKLKSSK